MVIVRSARRALAPVPRRWLRRRPVVGITGVLVLLLLASFFGGVAPNGVAANSGPAPSGLSGASPASAAHPSSAACSALASAWATLNPLDPGPSVAPSLQSPCVLGHDEPGLYLVSNASGSGSNVEFTLSLPANGTSPAEAYGSFWIGMWVAGVPCSYGGLSYLRVELLPPYSDEVGAHAGPFWTVRAPVWDLVPAGSCDSQCSNDTAFFTIAGRSYCEDDAVLAGVGSLNASGAGAFASGNQLTVTLAGTAGNSTPLAVYVNDTTDPTADLAWQYAANRTVVDGVSVNATVSGRPITPYYSNASVNATGWTDGLGLGYGWEDCPLPSAANTTGCNSYDAAVAGVAGSPQVDHIASWNRTAHAYSNLYPYVETASSSGACAGNAAAVPCADFDSYGGSATYPTFQVVGRGGGAWFAVGPPAADDASTFGTLAAEFPANGSLSGLEVPTTISAVSATFTSSLVTISSHLTDPNSVRSVTVTSWWCGPSIPARETNTTPAVLMGGGTNTPADGNWTTAILTNGWLGTFFYSVRAISQTGAATAPVDANVTITGTSGSTCGATTPPAPTLAAVNISAVGAGYVVGWNESPDSGVTHYRVEATPTGSGPTVDLPVGNVTSARMVGLVGNASYALQVVAFNPAGFESTSGMALAGKTLFPLVALLPTVVVTSTWVNVTGAQFSENATGGYPPFQMVYSFGDGSNATVFTTSGDSTVSHLYTDNYSGQAVVIVHVTDAVGDQAVTTPIFVEVQATPLAVNATIATGDEFVRVSWTAPPSPAPIRSYTVFWTTDAAWAPFLARAWPTNASIPAVNATTVPAYDTDAEVVLPVGTHVYAQVVAVNKYGDGALPPEFAPGGEPNLQAVVSNFASSPLTGGLLGTAPYNDSFTATFTMGAGNYLASATYHFPGGAVAPAAISGANGTYFANVSTTFEKPGSMMVYLYALDALSDQIVLFLTVDVTPGPAPLLAVTVAPTPVFVNTSVGFTANVTGGSGQYAVAWTFGDGGNATGTAVANSYTVPGTYIVAVTATDTVWGGVTTVQVPVDVLPAPTVEIVTTADGTAGTYTFTAVLLGGYGNFSYTWLFDDGTQGTGASVTHAWAPGRYTVTVEAVDTYGHTPSASVVLVVGYGSQTTGGGTNGYAPLVVYGLLGALVVVAVVAVLFALRSRRPPVAPATDESTGLAPLAPAVYEEEPPPGPR